MTEPAPTFPDDALLASIEAAAVSMAEEAGALISSYFGKEISTEFKDKEQTNPVTQVDKESQDFLERSILERYPDHGVLGEEDAEVEGESPLAPDFVWVLDPLDGTRNFMYGLPVYACSVGVLYKGSPVAGAVHVPWPGSSNGVVYHARAGGQTEAAGKAVRVFEAEQSEGNRIMAAPGSFGGLLRFNDGMHRNVGDLRMSGSLAFETAMTASGVLQYMITLSPKIWDVAAGVLLVQAAGGKVMSGRWSRRWGLVPDVEWYPFDGFVQWREDETTMSDLRKWSGPMVMGSAGVATYITRGISPRRRLGSSLRRAVRRLPKAVSRR